MANYPTSASTDANLFIAKNQLATQLDGSITNSQTTITVDSTTGFPTTGYITIDSEVISYTGVTATQFTGCTRGADGTGATTHMDNAPVRHTVVAAHHNVLKDELIAVETDLVAILAALTPATPGSTATSVLNRINQIVRQLQLGFNLTNWYDAPATWTAYTPTFSNFGTVTNSSFYYRVIGKTLQVKGSFQIGTPTASAASVTIPGGFTIDNAKIVASGRFPAGWMTFSRTSETPSSHWGMVFPDGSDTSAMFFATSSAAGSSGAGFNKDAGNAVNANTFVMWNAELPIS